ncbi:MAG TPA: hypothetical protein VFX50_04850 [Gemmatimonadales bacterium]|nr:hypothetical protein [Gemmatimonadales bacterium]
MTDSTVPPGTEGPAEPPREEPSLDEQMEARMRDWKARWAKLRAEMEQEMDELRVKAHLGREDAKDEWARFEARFKEIAADLDSRSDQVEEILEEKLKAIGVELKDGFERLRKVF